MACTLAPPNVNVVVPIVVTGVFCGIPVAVVMSRKELGSRLN